MPVHKSSGGTACSSPPVIASKPWELLAVDILKVPISSPGNQYYFSKWPFARAIPDQKADRIVRILCDEVFTLVGPPRKLHSDQGWNFERHILSDLCKVLHVAKRHTTPTIHGRRPSRVHE